MQKLKLSVAISEEHLDQQAFQETEEFKRLAREHYKPVSNF
ncbi:hypothetical protein ABIA69_002689 [Lysinibacillus parviboronicapiens]|uniref:YrzI family protein n=1 Tax=Lysinibacillus parviboronicapiens TaxID=436516 RepID=A0ABV2PKQ9_9BACI